MNLRRAGVAYAHDILMSGAAYLAALWLRLGDAVFTAYDPLQLATGLGLFVAVAAVVLRTQGLYRGVWRYASVNDLVAIAKAATLTILLYLPLLFLISRLETLPRSFLVIAWLVMTAFLGGPRFVYRLIKDRRFNRILEREHPERIPVLLAGAGDEAELFIRSLQQRAQADYEVVGLVSEKEKRVGLSIHGKDVLGTLDHLPEVVAALEAEGRKPRRLVLTHDFERDTAGRLFEDADAVGLSLARMPRLTDFRAGKADVLDVRPVAIEDLLGRAQRRLDREAMARLIAGRRVLITGAGGSIGSELVRQVAALNPAHLTLVELSEYALYTIDREMLERFATVPRAAVLADVRDAARMDAVFAAEKPDIVFHAAALKHVPIVEEYPIEGVRTNILGTRNVAEACRAHGVAAMVLISTDKAVNSTNVMGATKRVAEQVCQALDVAERDRPGSTRFMAVRFGNVLGSTGSVVPLFQRQLAQGGPLTVTHPDITRYFMTIREAVELVLQAAALGTQTEAFRGHVFVLDMGAPVKIVDLARNMIRLAGLTPDKDVEIAFTGLRPGEKLYEELFHGAEPPVPTDQDGIMVTSPRTGPLDGLRADIDRMEQAAGRGHRDGVLTGLVKLVPEYSAARAPVLQEGQER